MIFFSFVLSLVSTLSIGHFARSCFHGPSQQKADGWISRDGRRSCRVAGCYPPAARLAITRCYSRQRRSGHSHDYQPTSTYRSFTGRWRQRPSEPAATPPLLQPGEEWLAGTLVVHAGQLDDAQCRRVDDQEPNFRLSLATDALLSAITSARPVRLAGCPALELHGRGRRRPLSVVFQRGSRPVGHGIDPPLEADTQILRYKLVHISAPKFKRWIFQMTKLLFTCPFRSSPMVYPTGRDTESTSAFTVKKEKQNFSLRVSKKIKSVVIVTFHHLFHCSFRQCFLGILFFSFLL